MNFCQSSLMLTSASSILSAAHIIHNKVLFTCLINAGSAQRFNSIYPQHVKIKLFFFHDQHFSQNQINTIHSKLNPTISISQGPSAHCECLNLPFPPKTINWLVYDCVRDSDHYIPSVSTSITSRAISRSFSGRKLALNPFLKQCQAKWKAGHSDRITIYLCLFWLQYLLISPHWYRQSLARWLCPSQLK